MTGGQRVRVRVKERVRESRDDTLHIIGSCSVPPEPSPRTHTHAYTHTHTQAAVGWLWTVWAGDPRGRNEALSRAKRRKRRGFYKTGVL